jgi:hypothetical protein
MQAKCLGPQITFDRVGRTLCHSRKGLQHCKWMGVQLTKWDDPIMHQLGAWIESNSNQQLTR